MNVTQHWQALYDAIRAGLDADGLTGVAIAGVHSSYTTDPSSGGVGPPYVTYTVEALSPTGTFGGGPNEVLADTWRITARAEDMADMLAITTALTDKFAAQDIATTADGYVTTAVRLRGTQTLWEMDSKLHAMHMRILWERSK